MSQCLPIDQLPDSSWVDMHAHVLPGVDDGPKTWDESLALLSAAAEAGTKVVVATSHLYPDGPWAHAPNVLTRLSVELGQRAKNAGLDVTVCSGAEVYITADIGSRWDRGELVPLNGQSAVLCEFPQHEVPVFAEAAFYELGLRGVTAVLAHPERNESLMKKQSLLRRLVAQGVVLQVNASSIAGHQGVQVAAAAERLLKEGWVQLIASDAHSVRRRHPDMRSGIEIAANWIGEEAALKLVTDWPRILLRGSPLPTLTVNTEPLPKNDHAVHRVRVPIWKRWLFRSHFE